VSRFAIHTGDCIEEMRKLEEGSVDAVVTDPPYGIGFMGHEWDQPGEFGATKANGRPGVHRRGPNGEPQKISEGSMEAGRYDLSLTANRRYQAWCEAWAREAFRVLKPGGYLLASCGSRTYHRLAAGVEDAGFEIRDSIMWLYGSGFPKSRDVSKAIDKAAGAEREVVGQSPSQGMALRPGASTYVNGGGDDRTTGTAADLTAPATPEAAQWEGWGTALKPAHEPIVVARKPLVGTVAENLLEHGTGGLNIDACRIEHQTVNGGNLADNPHLRKSIKNSGSIFGADGELEQNQNGRWPANVVLDEEAAAELDAQSGELHSQDPATRKSRSKVEGVTEMGTGRSVEYADRGGASRFFYCAKTSRAERNAGLEGFEEKPPPQEYRLGAVEGNPRKPSKCSAAKPVANNHPTVKPINLMRWLGRLVTPPGGLVLDPFLGSGSTGCAAVLEGFDFVGIEREEEYVAIAEARMAFWARHEGREVEEVLGLSRKAAAAAKRHQEADQLGLELA
jgi:DNA modification methylase